MMRKYVKWGGAAVVVVGLLGWLFSNDYDKNKPTEFYEIEDGVYVVHNASYDTLEIKKAIEVFNLQTLPVDSIIKYGGCGRLFYRETKYMTRNFKEGNDYDPKYSSWNNAMDFRNHEGDILMTISYSLKRADGRMRYSYWLNWNYNSEKEDRYSNEVDLLFNNLDSLYQAKKEAYGTNGSGRTLSE